MSKIRKYGIAHAFYCSSAKMQLVYPIFKLNVELAHGGLNKIHQKVNLWRLNLNFRFENTPIVCQTG